MRQAAAAPPTRSRASARAVSALQLGRLFGKSRSTVAKWLTDGCPRVRAARREDGEQWLLDPAAVHGWLVDRACARERAIGAAETAALREALDQSGGESASWSAARARRMAAQAAREEIRLAQERGEVASWPVFETIGVKLVGGLVQRIDAVPAKAAPEAFGAKTIAECEAVIRLHQNEAREELSNPDWLLADLRAAVGTWGPA